MKVEFRESFLKDLRNIKNAKLLAKVRKAIENAEGIRNSASNSQFQKIKRQRFIFSNQSWWNIESV